ncbi:antigen 5 like allergen Cul n 1-like [Episyrphus balteatus]|uniref:antigen 5 like allergen Cul n 1-like n=1 Tax=Episyrphus balteatus TaxID=286459 RepID=UPI002485D638|nr:antigen 5 like allergen Cul n 1-like [Episyrphus balteatus]
MLVAGSLLLFIAIASSGIAFANFAEYNTDELYCDPELCRLYNGTHFVVHEHIGCDNNGTLSPSCGDAPQLVEMNQRRINLILDLHNAARNRIAIGKLPGYKPAAAMPVVKWDNELEFLAGLNVRTCRFKHDSCRNTDRFTLSGQNIGYIWQTRPIRSISRRIKFIVGKWFFEFPDAGQDYIESYKNHPKGKLIGHFTQMVSDRVQRVGCAAIRYTAEPLLGYKFLMTCNYDFTNISRQRVYVSGKPASNCTNRPSGRYQGLCDWDEDYQDSEESDEIGVNSLDIPVLL